MKTDKSIKEQIHLMMEYLGIDEVDANGTCKYSDQEGLDAGILKEFNAWEVIHETCILKCRTRALAKYVDIEMANNNLWWCLYD